MATKIYGTDCETSDDEQDVGVVHNVLLFELFTSEASVYPFKGFPPKTRGLIKQAGYCNIGPNLKKSLRAHQVNISKEDNPNATHPCFIVHGVEEDVDQEVIDGMKKVVTKNFEDSRLSDIEGDIHEYSSKNKFLIKKGMKVRRRKRLNAPWPNDAITKKAADITVEAVRRDISHHFVMTFTFDRNHVYFPCRTLSPTATRTRLFE